MKGIDTQVVIETVAECMKRNAALSASEQKEAKAIANDVLMAFRELDANLKDVSQPSRNKRPRP